MQCDDLIKQFHRFDESKNKWTGGSVTSICRGWGTTKKASLKAIYDFVRHKFVRPQWNGEERFPVTFYNEQDDDDFFTGSFGSSGTRYRSFVEKMNVLSGTGADYFEAMYVTHGNPGVVVGASVPSDNIGSSSFYQFQCDTNVGSATYKEANKICVDRKRRNDGEITIKSGNSKDDWSFSMYDFGAFEIVGEMYDDLIECAVSS